MTGVPIGTSGMPARTQSSGWSRMHPLEVVGDGAGVGPATAAVALAGGTAAPAVTALGPHAGGAATSGLMVGRDVALPRRVAAVATDAVGAVGATVDQPPPRDLNVAWLLLALRPCHDDQVAGRR